MRTIVKMLKDVGANMGGELAGFEPARAAELVGAGAAKIVVEFDPETHAFDPKTEKVSAIDSPAPAGFTALESRVRIEAENGELRGRVAELERDLAGAVELHAKSELEIEKLKADLGAARAHQVETASDLTIARADLAAAESLLAAPSPTAEEPPKS